jgi:alpha-D-xyloside xylohydrolase
MWTPEVRDAKTVADLVRRVQTVIFSPYAMINCWYMKLPPWLQIEEGKSNAGQEMEEAPEATRLVREAFRLRMSLVPYLYSAFDEYRHSGTPPVRALVLDYPDDAQTARIDDQFMFGPSMMAAPLIDGQSKRSVYFPNGDWFDFFTGERIHGGRTVVVEKPLGELPLYVKNQSLLPLAEPVSHIGSETTFSLHIRVYGDQPANATLIEDDGESLDFLKGSQTRVQLSWRGGAGSATRSGAFKKARYVLKSWDPIPSR